MMRRALPWLLVACLVTGKLWAAEDPFAAKWKLDPARSTLIDQMRVDAAGENKYAFNFSGTAYETIVADGTDQPGLYGSTLAVTVEGPDAWKVVRKKDGRTLLVGIWKLSDDGKTLSDHYTEYRPDGSTLVLDYVYRRTAGSAGFPGRWESSSEKASSPAEIQIETWMGDGLSFITPGRHETQNMKFDGKDYAVTGPDADAGSMTSARRVNERTLEVTEKFKGRVTSTREIKLSADNKTLTITVYPEGHATPNILVFDRD